MWLEPDLFFVYIYSQSRHGYVPKTRKANSRVNPTVDSWSGPSVWLWPNMLTGRLKALSFFFFFSENLQSKCSAVSIHKYTNQISMKKKKDKVFKLCDELHMSLYGSKIYSKSET